MLFTTLGLKSHLSALLSGVVLLMEVLMQS